MLTEQIIQCLFGVGEQHRVKIQSVAQVYAKRKATKKESYTANFCNYFFFVSLFLPLSLSPSLSLPLSLSLSLSLLLLLLFKSNSLFQLILVSTAG